MLRSLTVFAVIAVAGCHSPRVVPVSGTVFIDGVPLTHGFVQVAAVGQRPATGVIGPDGRFTLTTMVPGDGCMMGTHPVAVIGKETKGPTGQMWHAPQKYMDLSQSGLSVNITGPTDDLRIDLTWDGGKPFYVKLTGE